MTNFPNDPFDLDVGQRIASVRKKRRMSQTDLANEIGISYTMLQKHERGESTISAKRMLQIAKVLGVPHTDFLPCENLVNKPGQFVLDERERALISEIRSLKNKIDLSRIARLVGKIDAIVGSPR